MWVELHDRTMGMKRRVAVLVLVASYLGLGCVLVAVHWLIDAYAAKPIEGHALIATLFDLPYVIVPLAAACIWAWREVS